MASTTRALAFLLLVSLFATACGGARPYRAMARAAQSEESVFSQAEDHRLKMSMREAIVGDDPGAALAVTPYSYVGHAYLVGFVDSPDTAARLQERVRGLSGVRSVDAYLPTRPADRSKVDDVEIEAKLKEAVVTDMGQVASRIEAKSLAGHVVLLGVVSSPETVADAGNRSRGVTGVTGVTNFLLVPEAEYESLRPHVR
jgi:hyperosmotically inducible protein